MEAFRKALLLGKEEDATKAYKTGFVNLNTPYTIYHGEVRDQSSGINVGTRTPRCTKTLSRMGKKQSVAGV